MDRNRIDVYEQGGESLRRAIDGLTRDELLARPVPGKWSAQELVVHMLDSDLVATDRMKRIAAMDRPLLLGYDENAFLARLSPHRLDGGMAAELFALNRRMTAAVLRTLPDQAFTRDGVHNETGLVTLGGLVEGYIAHLDHHLRFLLEKRAALGRPLRA